MNFFTKKRTDDKVSDKQLKKSADSLSVMAMEYYKHLKAGKFDEALETALSIRRCIDVWVNIAKASTQMMDSLRQTANNIQKGIDSGKYSN